jgi:arsenite methyltransferase
VAPDCGHDSVVHLDHVGHLHDGHVHREHLTDGGHYGECSTCSRSFEFLKDTIEALPLPGTIDVAISNCVINLSVDKPAVFFHVLVPGDQIGITDIVADDELDRAQHAERGSYVACIAGAPTFAEYRDGLAAARFANIESTPTRQVAADGMHSAIIRATNPQHVPSSERLPT